MKHRSQDIKLAVMAWLRFGKRMPIVCTEVGPWNCDVLGLDEKMAVEIEVKVSREDVVREFENKKAKHFLYASGSAAWSIPNYFYFAFPHTLATSCVELIKTKAPKAGLLGYHGSRGWDPRGAFDVLIRAKKLHEGVPKPKLIHQAMLRMSSELVGLYTTVEELRGNEIEDMRNAVVTETARLSCGLDVEDPQQDLERRAAELAMAVERVDFAQLSDEAKQKWIDAAHMLLGHPSDGKPWALRF